MGLTQTKLHRAIIQGDWEETLQQLQKNKSNAMIVNPYGDYPIHLACYSANVPPCVIRKLISSCPEAVTMKNKNGHDPLRLAEINYRSNDPNRAKVLSMLHTFVDAQKCCDYETDTESSVQSIMVN